MQQILIQALRSIEFASSSIVQESVEKCEVVHTSKKVFLGVTSHCENQAICILIGTLKRLCFFDADF
jgi:hypothetical protein